MGVQKLLPLWNEGLIFKMGLFAQLYNVPQYIFENWYKLSKLSHFCWCTKISLIFRVKIQKKKNWYIFVISMNGFGWFKNIMMIFDIRWWWWLGKISNLKTVVSVSKILNGKRKCDSFEARAACLFFKTFFDKMRIESLI